MKAPDVLKANLDAGMSADAAAQIVLTGIREDRFWIFPNAEPYFPLVEAEFDGMGLRFDRVPASTPHRRTRMGSYQAFELEALRADRSRAYAEFLRRPGVSMGIYHVPVGGEDRQHPHAADEIYVVLAGRATLVVEGEKIDVGPGKVISVDVGADHRFIDVVEDLQILVVFAPPDDPRA